MIADLGLLAVEAEYAPTEVLLDRPGGTYVGSKWVPSAAAPVPVMASMQPMSLQTSGLMLKDESEGVRNEAMWMMYSRTAVTTDDIVTYGGDRYRVIKVWDWIEMAGFCRAALGMIKP